MKSLTHFPLWKELAHIISEKEREAQGQTFTDDFLSEILEAPPRSREFVYSWLKCREYLLKKKGIDFTRVRVPQPGYKAMTDTEKVRTGFNRRLNKTRRNVRRVIHQTLSVSRQGLSEDDARAYDVNMARAGLMQAVFMRLPSDVTNLRITIDLSNDTPKLE